MGDLFKGTETMVLIAVMVNLIVFIAMMVDLASGMYKAWFRKEAWKSDYLKRTGFKFVLYEGALLIATCVDLLVHFSKLSVVGLGYGLRPAFGDVRCRNILVCSGVPFSP